MMRMRYILGIMNPVKQAEFQYCTCTSSKVTPIEHIIEHSRELPAEAQEEQFEVKHEAHMQFQTPGSNH